MSTNTGGDPRFQLQEPAETVRTEAEKQIGAGQQLAKRPVASQSDLDALSRDIRDWSDFNRALLQRAFCDQEVAAAYAMQPRAVTLRKRSMQERLDQERERLVQLIDALTGVLQRLEQYHYTPPAPPSAPSDGGSYGFQSSGT